MRKKSLVILSGILVLLLIVNSFGVVSAKSGSNIFKDIGNFFKGIFTGWGNGNFSGNSISIKFLILILVTLFVFSILDSIHIFGRNRISLFVISLVIGILSTYFMSRTELLTIGNIYSAFGGTLVTIIPFLILGAFTIRALLDNDAQLMIMQHIAWWIFVAFLVYTLIVNWKENSNLVIYFVVLGLALIMAIFNQNLLVYFQRRLAGIKRLQAAETIEDINTGMDILRGVGSRARS